MITQQFNTNPIHLLKMLNPTGHSSRATFATVAHDLDVDTVDIANCTKHKDLSVTRQYIRPNTTNLLKAPMAVGTALVSEAIGRHDSDEEEEEDVRRVSSSIASSSSACSTSVEHKIGGGVVIMLRYESIQLLVRTCDLILPCRLLQKSPRSRSNLGSK